MELADDADGLDDDTGEQLVDTEMKVLDTPAQEIRNLIDSLQLG